MMVKLLTNQIPKLWPVIKECVVDTIPDFLGDEIKLSSLLKALMIGEMQCWVLANDDKVKAVVLTTVTHDCGSGTSNLLIYCLRAFGEMGRRDWAEGFVTLKRFAKANGCQRIVGYTDNDGVIRLVERLGGEARYKLVTIPLT